jgi:hypothetical protein
MIKLAFTLQGNKAHHKNYTYILLAKQINKMGGACGTCRGEVHTAFRWENMSESDHFEYLDWRIILK